MRRRGSLQGLVGFAAPRSCCAELSVCGFGAPACFILAAGTRRHMQPVAIRQEDEKLAGSWHAVCPNQEHAGKQQAQQLMLLLTAHMCHHMDTCCGQLC